MTLEQVLTKIKDIPSLVDAIEVDELIDHVSGWLQDQEELALVDQLKSEKSKKNIKPLEVILTQKKKNFTLRLRS